MNYKVTVKYNPEQHIDQWIRKKCASYITSEVHYDNQGLVHWGLIDYWFAEEIDTTIFLLMIKNEK